MKIVKNSIFASCAVLYLRYFVLSFLSLLELIDHISYMVVCFIYDKFDVYLGFLYTGLWLKFFYSNEEMNNLSINRDTRFEWMNSYYDINHNLILGHSFYKIAVVITILAVCGIIMNISGFKKRNKNAQIIVIILIFIIVSTIQLTISNAYSHWSWWDSEVV